MQPGLLEHFVDVVIVQLLAKERSQISSGYQPPVGSIKLVESRLRGGGRAGGGGMLFGCLLQSFDHWPRIPFDTEHRPYY